MACYPLNSTCCIISLLLNSFISRSAKNTFYLTALTDLFEKWSRIYRAQASYESDFQTYLKRIISISWFSVSFSGIESFSELLSSEDIIWVKTTNTVTTITGTYCQRWSCFLIIPSMFFAHDVFFCLVTTWIVAGQALFRNNVHLFHIFSPASEAYPSAGALSVGSGCGPCGGCLCDDTAGANWQLHLHLCWPRP